MGQDQKYRDPRIVFCTNTYHHGAKTQPVCDYAGERGIPMIDAHHTIQDGEAMTKDWESAFLRIMRSISYSNTDPNLDFSVRLFHRERFLSNYLSNEQIEKMNNLRG